MIPAITAVRMSGAAHRVELPLLVLGPALGTSADTLWSAAAAGLSDVFDVLAWDLPGHGHNRAVDVEPFTVAELARGVLEVVDDVLAQRGEVGGTFAWAGDSVGGATGLHLMLDAPGRIRSAVLVCTGAALGDVASWSERVEQVRSAGTTGVVAASAQRWFGPGFADREPTTAAALLGALEATDDDGYVRVCQALATYDVRERLPEITVPVLTVAGSADVVSPPALLEEVAAGVADGRMVVLDGVGHLAPAEAPQRVAALVREHVLGEEPPGPGPRSTSDRHEAGTAVRREVLGDAHVDRVGGAASDFTRDFQELVTEYAWGEVWTRPGLDRRSRSLITLTALVARGHHDELALHVRAALRNGLSVDELKELLLQTAIYCGVPAANAAFGVAAGVLEEEGLL